MTRLWEYTDEDEDEAVLERRSRDVLCLYAEDGVFLTPPAARSLRDALNAYLEQTSTAEAWELP